MYLYFYCSFNISFIINHKYDDYKDKIRYNKKKFWAIAIVSSVAQVCLKYIWLLYAICLLKIDNLNKNSIIEAILSGNLQKALELLSTSDSKILYIIALHIMLLLIYFSYLKYAFESAKNVLLQSMNLFLLKKKSLDLRYSFVTNKMSIRQICSYYEILNQNIKEVINIYLSKILVNYSKIIIIFLINLTLCFYSLTNKDVANIKNQNQQVINHPSIVDKFNKLWYMIPFLSIIIFFACILIISKTLVAKNNKKQMNDFIEIKGTFMQNRKFHFKTIELNDSVKKYKSNIDHYILCSYLGDTLLLFACGILLPTILYLLNHTYSNKAILIFGTILLFDIFIDKSNLTYMYQYGSILGQNQMIINKLPLINKTIKDFTIDRMTIISNNLYTNKKGDAIEIQNNNYYFLQPNSQYSFKNKLFNMDNNKDEKIIYYNELKEKDSNNIKTVDLINSIHYLPEEDVDLTIKELFQTYDPNITNKAIYTALDSANILPKLLSVSNNILELNISNQNQFLSDVDRLLIKLSTIFISKNKVFIGINIFKGMSMEVKKTFLYYLEKQFNIRIFIKNKLYQEDSGIIINQQNS